MTVTLKKKVVIVAYFKMAIQRDNRVKVSALLRAGHKVSEVANLVGVSRATVYVIKIRMGEGVNRRAASDRKTVVDRDSLRDAIRGSPSMFMCQHEIELRLERRLCD